MSMNGNSVEQHWRIMWNIVLMAREIDNEHTQQQQQQSKCALPTITTALQMQWKTMDSQRKQRKVFRA